MCGASGSPSGTPLTVSEPRLALLLHLRRRHPLFQQHLRKGWTAPPASCRTPPPHEGRAATPATRRNATAEWIQAPPAYTCREQAAATGLLQLLLLLRLFLLLMDRHCGIAPPTRHRPRNSCCCRGSTTSVILRNRPAAPTRALRLLPLGLGDFVQQLQQQSRVRTSRQRSGRVCTTTPGYRPRPRRTAGCCRCCCRRLLQQLQQKRGRAAQQRSCGRGGSRTARQSRRHRHRTARQRRCRHRHYCGSPFRCCCCKHVLQGGQVRVQGRRRRRRVALSPRGVQALRQWGRLGGRRRYEHCGCLPALPSGAPREAPREVVGATREGMRGGQSRLLRPLLLFQSDDGGGGRPLGGRPAVVVVAVAAAAAF